MTAEARLPYPGLRAYARDETDLFFGREGCVNEMVDRLAATKFLAVLGTSGSGKSSLVRTGLLDALELGLHTAAGSRWTVADCHPGEHPLRNLAIGLLTAKLHREPAVDEVDTLEAFLGRGPLAIVEWLADGNLAEQQNLLILVDQFEELFRYSDYAGREQAEAFVALLLESTSRHPRVHVTITMRSEYLGACALIPGLAEQINAGLYLARRMTRQECREAIVGPAAVVGFDIEPVLVTRLLNDLSGFAPWEADHEGSQLQRLSRQADQLPLMQHVLSRLWQLAARRNPDGRLLLSLQDYIDIGELGGALQQHAEEVIASLPESSRPFVGPLFRALVAGANLADAVRRPRRFSELVAVTAAPREQVLEIVDAFRSSGCNFLRPPLDQELKDGSVVDISHESLIRQWSSLSAWFSEEADYSAQWARLMSAEARHSKGLEDLLSGLTLANTAAWWDREKPNKAWAQGHGGNYDRVSAFLAESREAQEARTKQISERAAQEERNLRLRSAAYAACALISIAFAGYGFYNARVNDDLRAIAENQTEIAIKAAKTAKEQTVIAIEAAKTAEAERQRAEESARLAKENQSRALSSLSQLELAQDRPANALKLAIAAWPRQGESNGPQLRVSTDSLSKAMPVFIDKIWLRGHETGSQAGAFSPDGSRVATAMWDDTVRIWDVATGEQISILIGHEGPVNHVVFAPDGTRIATSSGGRGTWGFEGDSTARIWDATTGSQLAVFAKHEGSITSVGFSADGSRVLTAAGDNTVRIWDSATGVELAQLNGHSNSVARAVYSPDGKYVATASLDGTARVWDADTGAQMATTEASPGLWLNGVAFSPDGRQIATAGDDDKAGIWETATGARVALLEHGGDVKSVQFSPDGKSLVTASEDGLRIWNTASWQSRSLDSENGYYTFASFSPDGSHVLSRRSYHDAVDIWNARTLASVASLPGHGGEVFDTKYSPRGDRILTTSANGTARLWDAISGNSLAVLNPAEALLSEIGAAADAPRVPHAIAVATGNETLRIKAHTGPIYSAPFSSDGKTIITASKDGNLRRWNAATGAASPPLLTLATQLNFAALSRDGLTVAVASGDGKVRLLEFATGKILREIITGHAFMVSFSPDGHSLVTAHEDGNVRLWNADTGAPGLSLGKQQKPVSSATFSIDGSRIVAASEDGSVHMWDAANGTKIGVFGDKGADGSKALFAELAPDGRFVVVATENNGLQVWSVETGKKLATLGVSGSRNGYYHLAFSPDGTRVVAGGNGSVTIWDWASWVEMVKLDSGSESIWSVAFSPDGNRVVAGNSQGTVAVVDISMMMKGDAFAVACQYLRSDTNLADAAERYGLGKLQPICGDHPPLPANAAAIR